MNILVTGAFGNLGARTVRELLRRGGHKVACLDLQTKATKKAATEFGNQIELIWADILDQSAVKSAVVGRDVVIHLAALIPPKFEKTPEYSWKVNVNGTQLLVDILTSLNPSPGILFCSSMSVYGSTLHLPPPRKVTDPLNPIDDYPKTKAECEKIIQKSGLKYVILRLGAATPAGMAAATYDPIMFRIPKDQRIEFVHPDDVALAIVNAISTEEAWGHIYNIGGGKECQIRYKDYMAGIMTSMGIGALDDSIFGKGPFYMDWLDTEESQRVLQYQRKTYQQWLQEFRDLMGWRRGLFRLMGPMARWSIKRMKPKEPAGEEAKAPNKET
jgi:UDP-glucose 4-epimerase